MLHNSRFSIICTRCWSILPHPVFTSSKEPALPTPDGWYEAYCPHLCSGIQWGIIQTDRLLLLIGTLWEQSLEVENGRTVSVRQITTSPNPWSGQADSFTPHFPLPFGFYLGVRPLEKCSWRGNAWGYFFWRLKKRSANLQRGRVFLQTISKAFPVLW